MNLKVFFASFINLLVALAVPAANADNPITKLKVGKFFLECKGDCSDKFSFRDNGFLTFGTNKQVITNTGTKLVLLPSKRSGTGAHTCDLHSQLSCEGKIDDRALHAVTI